MKNSDRIFIPLTLDNSTKRIFTGKQIIGSALFILAFLLLQIAALNLGSTLELKISHAKLITIAADLVATYLLVYLFRQTVLNEKKMMQEHQDNQELQKTDISFCWNIYAVRDNKIYYCNGMQGLVVCLTHGYLLDRPEDQEEVHRSSVMSALGSLTKQGFSFLYFNREVQDSNLEPLRVSERRLPAFKGLPFYHYANDIIKHTYKVCSSIANTEQEYYLILAGDMDTTRRLDYVAKEFINALHGGIYVKMEVLDTPHIWQFISEQFGVSFIDPSTLLSKKFEDSNIQMVEILEVVRTEQQQEDKPPEQVQEPETKSQVEDWLLEEWALEDQQNASGQSVQETQEPEPEHATTEEPADQEQNSEDILI